VGSWNPAILQPGWIVKQSILPEGEAKVELATPMGISAQPVLTRFTLGDFVWIPRPSRLEVLPNSETADPGAFVAAILRKLEHTPVQAAGNNFHFDPGEHGKALLPLFVCPGWKRLREQEEEVGADAGIKLSHPTGLVNISIESSPDRVSEIRFNFHREMAEATKAAEAAQAWKGDRDHAWKLLSQIVENVQ
jgi:hypothetical protein